MDLPEPDDRLNSWKDIAAFLGRTVRTVQRWEKNEGLPLRRGGPGPRGAVVASKREIGEWWARRLSTLEDERAIDGSTADGNPGSLDRLPVAPDPLRVRRRLALYVPLIALVIAITAAVPFWRRVDATAASPRLGRLLANSTSETRTVAYVPLHAVPSGLALAPSGDLAYVAIQQQHAVAVVDLRSRRVVDRFEVVHNPSGLIVSPDGARLVIKGDSELGVFDLRRWVLTRFTGAGGVISDMHLSRDGRHVWTTLAQAGLKILDLETGRWETIPTVGCPMYLSAGPRSRRPFLAYQCGGPSGSWGHDAIEIIDEIKRTPIVARAGLPLVGSRLAISPDEQHLWIDTHDACAIPEYDQVGCPPGSGPVLHALRASTLDPLLTIRVPGHEARTTPIFFPDGTRLVLTGSALNVIDRALGTVFETLSRQADEGVFTADGRRFVMLDPVNSRLLDFDVSPPPAASALGDAATHWSGDGTANDIVGGAHALSMEGLRFEPGRYGQAFSFDGTTGGVNFGRRLNANIASAPAAYVAWIKTRRTGAPLSIGSRTGSLGWRWWITTEGRLAFCFVRAQPDLSCETGALVGHTTLRPDRWHHVSVVRSESAVTLFVDAVEEASKSVKEGFDPPHEVWNEAVMRLGGGPDGSAPFYGLIDEVLFFRRALSTDDLQQVMRATRLGAR